jgi:import inner membrane translocase subunit TIM44
VIRLFQQYDPSFNPELFLATAREYMIPEIMEAFLQGDIATLKEWCSESVSAHSHI